MNDDEVMRLCDLVRDTGFAIHNYLRSGHLEKVYENALVHRLRKQGLKVEQQTNLTVYDEDGTIIGHFVADLVIEGMLIAELKACKMLGDEHVAQVLGYLRASHMRHGILMNFGAPKFQMRKFVL